MEKHQSTVAAIADRVKHFHTNNQPFRIYHGTTNSTRALNFDRDRIIDTSSLNHVLRVDPEKQVALVEPNVSMESLVEATLKHGLVPEVVMEFTNITAGGGFSGTSGESSSFKYGFFENTVQWIEIVLGNGSVTTARRGEQSEELLENAAGSFGTFGVVTLLEIRLIAAEKYVVLDVIPVKSVEEAVEKLKSATSDSDNAYVDGILYSQQLGVVMAGKLESKISDQTPVVRTRRARDQWFYRHIEKKLARDPSMPFQIAVPIVDYLFRYDRGAFWTGKYAFHYFCMPFNRITRFILDPLMSTKVMFHAFHESRLGNSNIAQDIGIPSPNLKKFIDYLDEDFGYYPLWLCPLRKGQPIPLRPKMDSEAGDRMLAEEMPINVGLWGPGPKNERKFVDLNRRIEKKTLELNGAKCLYARAYYTADEFWSIYDRKWYDEQRAKYHASGLPSVYDKVAIDLDAVERRVREQEDKPWLLKLIPSFWDTRPFPGIYGALKALVGLVSSKRREYILAKS